MAYSTWIQKRNRNGGEWNSSNVTIPSGIDTVRIHLVVNSNDFNTEDKSITGSIEISTDGAQTWRTQLSVGWMGGTPSPRPGGQVGWYAAVSGIGQYAGALARAHISQSGNFSWGLEGELL
jgi:hypothetical protein